METPPPRLTPLQKLAKPPELGRRWSITLAVLWVSILSIPGVTLLGTSCAFKTSRKIVISSKRGRYPFSFPQTTEHIEEPVNAVGPYYIISVQNPDGLQSKQIFHTRDAICLG